jgi:uncharacterized membrane protein YphA (DoxX/SURF4 family)
MGSANILFLIGRIVFGAYWLTNAGSHLVFNRTALKGYASSKHVPLPGIAIGITGILLLLGGAGIVLGVYTAWAIGALILFLLPVTLIMHDFWLDKDPAARASDMINFSKNLALLAALLMLLAIPTPWPFALF